MTFNELNLKIMILNKMLLRVVVKMSWKIIHLIMMRLLATKESDVMKTFSVIQAINNRFHIYIATAMQKLKNSNNVRSSATVTTCRDSSLRTSGRKNCLLHLYRSFSLSLLCSSLHSLPARYILA